MLNFRQRHGDLAMRFFSRHWPVLVMGVGDLPANIAGGACTLQPGCGFPMNLTEVSAKGRPEEAYPVLVLGTQVGITGHHA
jgi:hypothetical protein